MNDEIKEIKKERMKYFEIGDGRIWDRADAERFYLQGKNNILVYLSDGEPVKGKLLEAGMYVLVLQVDFKNRDKATVIVYKNNIKMIMVLE